MEDAKNSKLIQQSIRLSESKLWDLQKNYFITKNISAFEEEVPYFISSNAAIANYYSDLLINYILDLKLNNNREPVYILELGAGTGLFSYYFLKSFTSKLLAFNLSINFCYIVSDCLENLDNLKKLDIFQDYIKNKQLDFAKVELDKLSDINLLLSGIVLSKNKLKYPLVLIANYIFDCVAQDLIKINKKQIIPQELELSSRFANFNQKRVSHLDELRFKFLDSNQGLQEIYQDINIIKTLEKIASDNQDEFYNLVPIGAIDFINYIIDFTDNNYLLLIGDRGVFTQSELKSINYNNFKSYDGCYSFLVNFYFLKEYFSLKQVNFLFSKTGINFKVGIITSNNLYDFYFLKNSYRNNILRSGPNELVALYEEFRAFSYRFDIKAILSFIRIFNWDPLAYSIVHTRICELLLTLDQNTKNDLLHDLAKIEDNIYPVFIDTDFYNLLGNIYLQLENYSKAKQLYLKSLRLERANKISLSYPNFNLGLIYENTNNKNKALEYFKKSYQLDPKNIECRNKIRSLEGKAWLNFIPVILKGLILLIIMGSLYWFLNAKG